MAPPKASDGGRSVRLSLSFGPVTMVTVGEVDMGGLSNSAIGVGEQEARLLEFAETTDCYHVIRSYDTSSNFDLS